MSESYIQQLFADRIGGYNYGKDTAIYKFEKIKRAKRAAMAANPSLNLIDMGVGEPDAMAPSKLINALYRAAKKPENRGYADNGDDILKKLPAVLINPGDYVLMTIPGYPVFGTHAKYYGGKVYNMPLLQKNHFLPDLKAVPKDILAAAKVMVINYPNNPTGANATPEFFAEVVDFAKRNNLVVVHDAAYAALVFQGQPLSFLATPGAMDVGIELHSASKMFNMTGWRCGFVVGNPLLVKAYGDVKDNTDSGQFLAIQHAVAEGLENPGFTKKIVSKYSRRMTGLVRTLKSLGFKAKKPKGSFFLYTAAPKAAIKADGSRVVFNSAEEASQWLITEKLISTVPWDDAGAYLRFSVTFSAPTVADEKAVLEEIASRLRDVKFEF